MTEKYRAKNWRERERERERERVREKTEQEEQRIYSTRPNVERNVTGKCIVKCGDWQQKFYDMVLPNWIMDSLKMYNLSYKVIKFISEQMNNCKVELIAGGKTLVEVKIQGDIFLGDALSPLLFVIAMISFNYIFRNSQGTTNLLNCKKRSTI